MKTALRLFWLNLKMRGRSMKPGAWIMVALGATIFPALGIKAGQMVVSLSMRPHDLLFFLGGALNLLLLIQVGTAFSAAFETLYLSRDLPLLLASPVSPRWVILAKILTVIGAGATPYLAVGAPLLLGIGMAWYAPFWYYPLAFLAGIPFIALPTVIAVALNLLLSRLVPAYRAKEISRALSLLLGAAFYIATRLFAYNMGSSGANTQELVGSLGRFSSKWSPSALLSGALVSGLYENPLPLLGLTFGFLVLAAGLFSLLTRGVERAYLGGWAAGGTPSKIRLPSRVKRPTRRVSTQRFAIERHSFLVESRFMFRDMESQSQAIYAMVMVLGMTIVGSRGTEGVSTVIHSFTPFMYLTMGGGYSRWGVKDMPTTLRLLSHTSVDPRRVMRGKALFYGLIQTAFVTVLSVIMSLLGRPVLGNRLMLGAVWMATAFATAAVAISAAAYDPKVPEGGGVPKTGTGATIAHALANLLIGAIAIAGYFHVAMFEQRDPTEAWMYVALIVGLMIGAFAIAVNIAGTAWFASSSGDSGQSSITKSALCLLLAFGLALAPLGSVAHAGKLQRHPTPIDLPDCSLHMVNGASVYYKRVPGMDMVQVGALMLVGTGDEKPGETHAAHMAEHMVLVYPGPSGESAWSIAGKDYAVGASLELRMQGATSLDFTLFVTAAPKDDAQRLLEALLGSMFKSVLTSDGEYAIEIKRAMREYNQMTRGDVSALLNKMRTTILTGTSYGEDIFATSFWDVKAEQIREFIAREYWPARLSLIVVGDIDELEVLGWVENCLEGIEPGPGPVDRSDVPLDPPEEAVLLASGYARTAGLVSGVSGIAHEDIPAVVALMNIATRRLYGTYRAPEANRFLSNYYSVAIGQNVVFTTYAFASTTQPANIETAIVHKAEDLREIMDSLAREGPMADECIQFVVPGTTREIQEWLPTSVSEAGALLEFLLVELEIVQDASSIWDLAERDPLGARELLADAAKRYLGQAKVSAVFVRSDAPTGTIAIVALLGVAFVTIFVWRKLSTP